MPLAASPRCLDPLHPFAVVAACLPGNGAGLMTALLCPQGPDDVCRLRPDLVQQDTVVWLGRRPRSSPFCLRCARSGLPQSIALASGKSLPPSSGTREPGHGAHPVPRGQRPPPLPGRRTKHKNRSRYSFRREQLEGEPASTDDDSRPPCFPNSESEARPCRFFCRRAAGQVLPGRSGVIA